MMLSYKLTTTKVMCDRTMHAILEFEVQIFNLVSKSKDTT